MKRFKRICENLARQVILFAYGLTRQIAGVCERARHHEIGITGHITPLDRAIVAARNLAPLTKFERWLLTPLINEIRNERRAIFRDAVREVTSEEI